MDLEDRFRAIGASAEPFRVNGAHQGEPEKKDRDPQVLPMRDPRTWKGGPPPRRWIVPDLIPVGVVTALYGDGGIGKTLLAQMLLTCTALGIPWLGMQPMKCRTLGIFCEDDEDELWRRQEAINAHLGITMDELGDMRLISRVGEENALVGYEHADRWVTDFQRDVAETCKEWRPGLLVADTAADLYPDNENDRSKVRFFIQRGIAALARDHKLAAFLLAHPSQSGLATGSGTGGSTAWNNTVRSRLYLAREKDGEGKETDSGVLILSRKKANYAASGSSLDMRLMWRRGVIMPTDATGTATGTSWPTIEAIFDEIERAWGEGRPWSNTWQSKRHGRYLPDWTREHHSLDEKRTLKLITAWQMNQCLRTEMADPKTKLTGLRVLRRPDPERSSRSNGGDAAEQAEQ